MTVVAIGTGSIEIGQCRGITNAAMPVLASRHGGKQTSIGSWHLGRALCKMVTRDADISSLHHRHGSVIIGSDE